MPEGYGGTSTYEWLWELGMVGSPQPTGECPFRPQPNPKSTRSVYLSVYLLVCLSDNPQLYSLWLLLMRRFQSGLGTLGFGSRGLPGAPAFRRCGAVRCGAVREE